MQLPDKLAIEKFVEKLNQVDFGSIAFKLMNPDEGEGWTLEQTIEAIEEYRHFLALHYLYCDRILVPSRSVDIVWHTAILDTKKYQRDCLELFGYFLHHHPFSGTTDGEDKQASETAFADTCQLLKRHFS